MRTKTRNLQLFFRALSASSMESDLGQTVPEEIARLHEAERSRAAQSGLHAAVQIEGLDD